MRKTIDRYIQNCYVCQRSKTSRNKSNDLLQSLFISEQQWQNIVMTSLSIYLIHMTTTLFWLSSADCWKKGIIFLASLMMKILQSKRQLKCCFNEYIKLTIYQALLYLIEILSSSSFFESFFANNWAFLFDCSLFITLRSMIKANELIRMLSDIFVSSVHTCRIIDSSDYLWSSLSTITSCLQSSSWFSSS